MLSAFRCARRWTISPTRGWARRIAARATNSGRSARRACCMCNYLRLIEPGDEPHAIGSIFLCQHFHELEEGLPTFCQRILPLDELYSLISFSINLKDLSVFPGRIQGCLAQTELLGKVGTWVGCLCPRHSTVFQFYKVPHLVRLNFYCFFPIDGFNLVPGDPGWREVIFGRSGKVLFDQFGGILREVTLWRDGPEMCKVSDAKQGTEHIIVLVHERVGTNQGRPAVFALIFYPSISQGTHHFTCLIQRSKT